MVSRRRAFTLIELLIVLIIIGVLAASMVLVAGSGSSKAGATNIASNLRSIKNACLMYYCDNDSYPPGISFIDLKYLEGYLNFSGIERAEAEDKPGYYIYRESSADGKREIIRAFYKNKGGNGPLFDEGVVRSLALMAERSGLYNENPDPTVLTESNIGTATDRYVSMFLKK